MKVLVAFLILFVPSVASAWTVCAIGDSHVEPRSALLRNLQLELGPEYDVVSQGRRGWTTDDWLRAGDFGLVCGGAEIILISLGGNDLTHGRDFAYIQANIQLLIAQLPFTARLIYHMMIPRLYSPRLTLALDGIHLARQGAREYAHILAPFLQIHGDLQP